MTGFGSFAFGAKTTASTGLFTTPTTTPAFGSNTSLGFGLSSPPNQTVGSPAFGQATQNQNVPTQNISFGAATQPKQEASAFGAPAAQGTTFGSPATSSFSFNKPTSSFNFASPTSGFSAPLPATSTTSTAPQTSQSSFSLGTSTSAASAGPTPSFGQAFGTKQFSFGGNAQVTASTTVSGFGASATTPAVGFGQTTFIPTQPTQPGPTFSTPSFTPATQSGLSFMPTSQTSTVFGSNTSQPTNNQGLAQPQTTTSFGTSQPLNFSPNTAISFGQKQGTPSGVSFDSTPTSQPGQGFRIPLGNFNMAAPVTSESTSFAANAPSQLTMKFGTTQSSQQPTLSFGTTTQVTQATASFGTTAQSTQPTNLSFITTPQTTQATSLSFGTTQSGQQPAPISFGTTTQATQPAAISFGTTTQSSQPTSIGFGTTAPSTQTSLSFGTKTPTSQPTTTVTGLSFGTIPQTTSSSGLSFGTIPQTTSSSGLSFGTSTGLNFAKPTTTIATTGAISTSAPSGITALGKTTTTSAMPSLTTVTSTTASLPPAAISSITFAQLEENINKWTLELEEQEKVFINQATQINAWDRLLIANGEKIVELNDAVETVKNEQQGLEHELDFVLAQQKELEELLEPLEKQLLEDTTDRVRDPEREHMYSLAESLDTQLRQMSEDLKEVIEHLNETNRSQDSNDPIVQIGRILNAHMSSMQWIDNSIAQISTKLDHLKSTHDTLRRANERSFQLTYN